MHTSKTEFIEEFKAKVEANRFEFESRGITVDDSDLGVTLIQIMDNLRKSITDKTEDDVFLSTFWRENYVIIGDVLHKSPAYIEKSPFCLTLSYKGQEISCFTMGSSIYDAGVYETFARTTQAYANSYILPSYIAFKFVEGDDKARESLMSFLDFENARNWTIVWAKLDWIKFVFPSCYKKMMEDGEFMSVEEAEEKMKEDA